MQLYAGLPIITNKITASEQQGVPHHLIGTIGLNEATWVVGTFVRRALEVVADIRARGRLPILVGGTHYYTQSLLFHDALANGNDETDPVNDGHVEHASPEEQWPVLAQPTEILLEELRRIDPIMASRWHPRDRRKIQRSLMINLQTGRRASDIYAEQQQRKSRAIDGHDDQSWMRFRQNLIFWVHAEQDALRSRLETRVDKMLDRGLLEEVQSLHEHLSAETNRGNVIDRTRGIWVSIGFKEFEEYWHLVNSGRDVAATASAKQDAIERTKIATRQYAKGQVRWIRLKLAKALCKANSENSFFLLDGSDPANFDSNVVQPAISITEKFLSGAHMPTPDSLSALAGAILRADPDSDSVQTPWTVKHCELCSVSCATAKQWEAHTKSRAHRKLSSKAEAQRDQSSRHPRQEKDFNSLVSDNTAGNG